jgi:hypothetical protein
MSRTMVDEMEFGTSTKTAFIFMLHTLNRRVERPPPATVRSTDESLEWSDAEEFSRPSSTKRRTPRDRLPRLEGSQEGRRVGSVGISSAVERGSLPTLKTLWILDYDNQKGQKDDRKKYG